MKSAKSYVLWLLIGLALLLPCCALAENANRVMLTNANGELFMLNDDMPSLDGLPGVWLDASTSPYTVMITGDVVCVRPEHHYDFEQDVPIFYAYYSDPANPDEDLVGEIAIRFTDAHSSLTLRNDTELGHDILYTGSLSILGGGTLTLENLSYAQDCATAYIDGDLNVLEASTVMCSALVNEVVVAERSIMVVDGSTLTVRSDCDEDGWPALDAMNVTVTNGATLTVDSSVYAGIRLWNHDTGDEGILTVENASVVINGGEYIGNFDLQKTVLTGVRFEAFSDREGTTLMATAPAELDTNFSECKLLRIFPQQ